MNPSFIPRACFIDSAIAELYADISTSRRIPDNDLDELIVALSEYSITEEENYLINRILYGIRRGWIKVVGNTTNALPSCFVPKLAVDDSQSSLNQKENISVAKTPVTPALV